jgi:hypothetical protein
MCSHYAINIIPSLQIIISTISRIIMSFTSVNRQKFIKLYRYSTKNITRVQSA